MAESRKGFDTKWLEERTGMSFPLAHATELPKDEKRIAVKGAFDLMADLDDKLLAETQEMVAAGEISPEAADKLWKLSCAHGGVLLDYVHGLVGFEGDHGRDLYTDEEWNELNQGGE